jgi:hypothetical protein
MKALAPKERRSSELQAAALGLFVSASMGCSDAAMDLAPVDADSAVQGISEGVDDSEHRGVLALTNALNSNTSLCTAALIAPNLVLTARHCVAVVPGDSVTCAAEAARDTNKSTSRFGATYPGYRIGVSADIGVGPNTDWTVAREVLVTEGSDEICGNDVAVVILDSNIDDVEPMTPRIDQGAGSDEIFDAVGYGVTGPYSGLAGRRRIREGLEVFCIHPFCPVVQVAESEFVADVGVCQGDSGGPAIDSEGRVFGIVSRSGGNCDYPLYGEVAFWKDWLIAAAERASELGDYPLPYWAETGSSETPPDPPPDEAGLEGEDGDEDEEPVAGDRCGAPSDCADTQLCVAPGGDFENPVCADRCALDDECPGSMVCDGGSGTCASPAEAVPLAEGGCSIARGATSRVPGHGGFVASLLVGIAWYLRRHTLLTRRST